MCYDIALYTSIELVTDYLPALKDIFSGQLNVDFQPTDHRIAQSYQPWPVILNDTELKIRMFEWGVIASYMNTPEKIKKNRNWMANARSEKIFDTKSYWHKIRKNRCVIPVNGFYEHREVKGFKTKIPYYISRKDQPLFFIAGLYNYSPIPDVHGESVGTFAVITREANPIMANIHNGGENAGRMPLILQNDMVMEWLKKDLSDSDMLEILDYEIPSESLDAWPVYSVRGRKLRSDIDGKERYERYEYEGLPPLGIDEVQSNTLF